MKEAEQLVAQAYPVYEQRYATDPFNPVKLYDCLVPQMMQYIRVPVLLYPYTHVEDIRLRIDLKHMEEATVSARKKYLISDFSNFSSNTRTST